MRSVGGTKMIDYKPIPCKHETDNIPVTTRLDDYHPLTKDEIRQLLILASTSRYNPTFSQIQCRLVQGIPGIKCPHELHSVANRKMNMIDIDFQTVCTNNIDKLTDQFNKLMNG